MNFDFQMQVRLTDTIYAKTLRNKWIGTYPLVLDHVDYSYIEGRTAAETYGMGRPWRAILRARGVRPSTIRRIARDRRLRERRS